MSESVDPDESTELDAPDESTEPDDPDDPDVACTITEADAQRRRAAAREDLLPRFRAMTELDDGVRLAFEGTPAALAAVAAFVGEEAECCSFATYRIEYAPPYDEVGLRITGPEGTTDLFREGLAAELEAFAASS